MHSGVAACARVLRLAPFADEVPAWIGFSPPLEGDQPLVGVTTRFH
jgi:hypothetical protein